MMPPGHIAVGLLSRHLWDEEPDWRGLAGAALLPDVIDKPLALLVFTDSHSTQNIAHSLLVHVLALVVAILWFRRALPYVLAFNTHLLADHMWYHIETFWYPLFGWNTFWQYKFMNSPQAMFSTYLDILRYPQVWVVEIFALAYLGWLGWKYFRQRFPDIRLQPRNARNRKPTTDNQ